MKKTLSVLHLLGLVLFLGSILTFVVASQLTEHAGLREVVFARELIARGTTVLTLPGMWLALLTGAAMAASTGRLREPWVKAKFGLGLILMLNAHLVVTPAVMEATSIAQQSLLGGTLLDTYKSAYLRESVFGALNVLITISLVVLAVHKRPAREKMA